MSESIITRFNFCHKVNFCPVWDKIKEGHLSVYSMRYIKSAGLARRQDRFGWLASQFMSWPGRGLAEWMRCLAGCLSG